MFYLQCKWWWTVEAVKLLCADIFAEGHTFVPTSRLNQDALENLFSSIRYNGGNRTKPSPAEFVPALKTCLINSITAKTKGNCAPDEDDFLVNFKMLFEESLIEGHIVGDQSMDQVPPPEAVQGGDHVDDRVLMDYEAHTLEAQGDTAIASAMLRKVLPLVQTCYTYETALAVDVLQPTSVILGFRDDEQQLGKRRYPCESLAELASFAVNGERPCSRALAFMGQASCNQSRDGSKRVPAYKTYTCVMFTRKRSKTKFQITCQRSVFTTNFV